MHSIVMPSSPAFLTISSFIASPIPCCPFLPLTMLQSPLKNDAVSRCRNFVSSVPFGLLHNPMTSQPFAAQQSVDMPDIVNAVDRCCTNVERAERELLQPRPRSGGLVFLAGGFPLRPFPRRFFRVNTLRLSPSSRCFLPSPGSCLRFSDVLGVTLPPRLDFSIVDTCAYSRMPSGYSSSPRFGYHVFRGGGAPTLLPQARLPSGNDFVLGCITASRCCWQACTTVSIDEFSHQSMS